MEEFLKEAVDSTFLNDSMFKNFGKESQKDNKGSPWKSKRFLAEPEEVDRDLPVTESMKKFMSKKLSDLVAKQTCFVEESAKERDPDISDAGIRLLKDSKEYIKDESIVNEDEIIQKPPRKKKKPKLPDELPEKEKIQQASVSPETILSQKDTKHWTTNKSKTYHYKEKNQKLYLQEPVTEFTKIRKKNNWDESKISKYKRTKA